MRPNRELGQNFLIDDNLLEVIGRAAELDADDVVLEVGGGLGVLSEYLAPRVAHLHVVEVDRSLEAPLRDALDPFANASLHLADAVKLDLPGARPPPGKVVANLPYGVAATVLLGSLEQLPEASLWVAMVQREVGDRLAATPGDQELRRHLGARPAGLRREGAAAGAAHGVPPRAQRGVRAGALRRTGPRPPPGVSGAGARRVRAPAQDAGGIAGARARARRRASARRPGRRSSSSATLPTRAPSGSRPADFSRLEEILGPARSRAAAARQPAMTAGDHRARPGQGEPGAAGRAAAGGRAAPAGLAVRLARPGRRGDDRGGRVGDEVVCPGVEGENLAARALAAFRAAGPDAALPPLRVTIDKRIPVAAGLGGGSADAAAVLRAANALAGAARRGRAASRGRRAGRDVPSQLSRATRSSPAPASGSSRSSCRRWRWCSCPPQGLCTAAVYAELDRLRAAGQVGPRASLDPAPLRGLASAPVGHLAEGAGERPRGRRLCAAARARGPPRALRGAGALGARITGSGPTAFGVFADRDAAEAAARTIPGALVTTTR